MRILRLILIFILFITSCSINIDSNHNDEKQENSFETNKNKKHNADSLAIEINNLYQLNKSDNLTIEEKRDNFHNFIKEIKKFLGTEESLSYSDEELGKLFQYKIKSKTKEVGHQNEILNIRLVEIDGGNVFGTLERKWIILQQWDANEIKVQALIEEGAEKLNDFLIIKHETPKLVLIGYNMALKHKGVSICIWNYKDETWNKDRRSFNFDNTNFEGWEVNYFENCMDINSLDYSSLSILVNEELNGFRIIANETQQELYFNFINGELLIDSPSPSVDANSNNEYRENLCTGNEEILFSFKLANSPKKLSVCISKTQELLKEGNYELFFKRFEVLDEESHTDIFIEYPQIKNMESQEIEMKVNELLREQAISDYEGADVAGLSLPMKTKVVWFTPNIISVKYSGYGYYHGAINGINIMYATNIDLRNGKIIEIQDLFNDCFQEKLNRNVFMFNGVGKESDGEPIEPNTHEYGYINADESIIAEMFNKYYSNLTSDKYYFGEDYFNIIVKVPSGPTAYLELAARYDDLKDCMNYDDGFWDAILKSK